MDDLAKLKAGIDFSLTGLKLINEAARKEGHLLTGPYANWLDRAAGNCAESADAKDPLAALRTAFQHCDILLRAMDRLPPDIHELIERFEETAQALNGLRPRLGDRGIDRVVAAAIKADDETQSCGGCKSCGGDQKEDAVPPVVLFVDEVFKDALRKKADEIELAPAKDVVLLQYRFPDRTLPVVEVSARLGMLAAARIKVMARLDIRNRERPQQGVISGYPNGPKDIPVGIWPRRGAERVLARLVPGKFSTPGAR
ncbi:MAG: ATPase, T2SS/T4P/T4SS family [Elusimicrobiota bacterium]